MESRSFFVEVLDEVQRRPLKGLKVELYYYGVTIVDSVITGTLAIPSSGEDEGTVIAVDKGNGIYVFNNILPGEYTVVVSGDNIVTQILQGWEKFNPMPKFTGSEIIWKEGETTSIASKLQALQDQIDGLT